MNYKSYSDIDFCIRANLHLIPRDVDIVAGIPRSGLMAASIVSLYLNVPLADVDGLLSGKLLGSGRRMRGKELESYVTNARKILVVDDSCNTGYEISRTRELLNSSGLLNKCIFCAIYASPEAVNKLDIFFEVCPQPRMFAWNMMHHKNLHKACVDIDGVLCVDPTCEQNDDGERYVDFLLNAKPLFVPSVRVGALVTCRLEKYRSQTTYWLEKHGITYDELIMWNLESKKARLEQGGHGLFKGNIYRHLQWADIFIESSLAQASVISNVSVKPVICIETQSSIMPSVLNKARGKAAKIPSAIFRRITSFCSKL